MEVLKIYSDLDSDDGGMALDTMMVDEDPETSDEKDGETMGYSGCWA